MYYALTLRKTRGTPARVDYELYIADMLHKNPSVRDCGRYYEYTKGLHVHMLLSKHGSLSHNDLKHIPHGWHVYLKPVYNLCGWKTYITKDQLSESTSSTPEGDPGAGRAGAESDTESEIDSQELELIKSLKRVRIV